ncbi:hypothetical protein JQC91_01965 [Jannaschia sp. Os4]|uniref:hypothetical protein n=1 Tax=Jannaschia sp. Os4 TaxID=2807617 RepID=UPI00193A1028|nr:hypothetical protein [Jannaschia sp. Os4]MBM2575059.1 hypothetical protein [Jannaschia sp. Os4]
MDALLFASVDALADCSEARRRGYNRAFAEAGLDWFWDRPLWDAMRSMGGAGRLAAQGRAAGVAVDIERLERATERQLAHVLRRDGLALRPGMGRLLDEARARGLWLGVAARGAERAVAAHLGPWDAMAEGLDALRAGSRGVALCVTAGPRAARAVRGAAVDAATVMLRGAAVLDGVVGRGGGARLAAE